MVLPPERIPTQRLILRLCIPDEAPFLRAAIDASLDHLRAWLPWAMKEPSSIQETRELIEWTNSRFSRGEDFLYTVFSQDESEVLGGVGLHRRAEPRCFEIGYWIRHGRTCRGYATEAVRCVAETALALPYVERIQIDCDPSNVASRRIPEKLGFAFLERRKANKLTPQGKPRDTLVFELTDASLLAEIPENRDEQQSETS